MLAREQVDYVARLARLELSDAESERMATELSKVLDHIEKIRELDLAGGPLRPVSVEQFMDDEDPPKLRWRAEFRRG